MKNVQELAIKALNGDKKAKNELINHYTIVITNYIETRYNNSNYDKDLLIKAGIDGLLKILNNWNKNDNIYFPQYILNHIHSNIKTEINKQQNKNRNRIIELVNKMFEGDSKAKNELIDHYMNLITKFVKKTYSNDIYNQEDLIQAGCVGLMKAINSYKSNLESIFPIYVKTFINYEINKVLDSEKENSKVNYIGLNNNYNDNTDFLYDAENICAINDIIDNMPKRTQEILYLYFYKEFSFVDIGKIYNISKQRVEQICKNNIEIIKYEIIGKSNNSEKKEKVKIRK